MNVDPRRIFNVAGFGIATLIVSAAVMAGVLYSIW
jgi:hypothetical protein